MMTRTMNQTQSLTQGIAMAEKQSVKKDFSIFVSRAIRIIFLFGYATLPMWTSWVASEAGLRDVSSFDMLIAMAWMPISGAIIALSFMKFGWKHKVKGVLAFIVYNAIALGCIVTWVQYS